MFDVRPKPVDKARAKAQASPGNAAAQVVLAVSLLHAKKIDEAQKAVDAALKIDPKEPSAHFVAAKLAGARRDANGEVQHLRAIQAAGGDGYTVQMALAELAEKRKDKAAMRAALEAAHRFDPSQSEPVKALYEMAREEKRDEDSLNLLRQLAYLEQHDGKVWRLLLTRLVDAQRWEEAAKIGEGALFVDIDNAGTHLAYGRALAATNRHGDAAFELESVFSCNPKPAEAASAHALLAKELAAQKKVPEAKKHLDEARRLDPNTADAKALTL
jgi:tetratricopeptide (TPR) repeat protein